ncbi:MAG: sigma-70 family RNA polymerase sigma factor [Ilumatobacteraceae bacterium]
MNARSASAQFRDLYEQAFQEVYSYVASRMSDRGAAEDVTQEVFVVGARHVARGGDVNVAWLKTVARNRLVDHWRARARQDRKLALAYSVAPPPVVDGNAPGDAERVAQVLADLNPTYRAALVLRHLDGLSVPEVAGLLGRSVEATEQVLSRARAAFRSAYVGASGATNV